MEDIHILLTVSLYVLRIRQASRCKLLCFSKTETYQTTCLIDCLMCFDPLCLASDMHELYAVGGNLQTIFARSIA